MKKILLSTTAIVAATAVSAGVAQAGETVFDISGSNTFAVGVADLDYAATTGERFDIYENGEIIFRASTTTDAGLTVGWRVDYETEQSNGNFVDENFFTISDDWGSVTIGATNLPNNKMHYTGGMWVGNHGLSSHGWGQWTGTPAVSEFSGAFLNDNGVFSASDPDSISYYTPRMSGVQLGVGYAPDINANDGNGDNSALEDTVSVGINYVADHGDVGVAVSGGYITHGGGTSVGTGDVDMFHGGINLSTGGLTFGLSFADSSDDVGATPGGEGWTAMAGVTYATGPYTLGLSYATSEVEETRNDGRDTEGQEVVVMVDYALGGGVDVDAALLYRDIQGEDVGNGDDQEGWLFKTGINVGF